MIVNKILGRVRDCVSLQGLPNQMASRTEDYFSGGEKSKIEGSAGLTSFRGLSPVFADDCHFALSL